MSAHLSATKSHRVTLAQLSTIQAPAGSKSWRPISHAELVNTLKDRLAVAGYDVAKEQYAVQGDEGVTLFGALDLATPIIGGSDADQCSLALGFRHANNRKMALSIVVGARVYVCDNMNLSGDSTVFKNKHTPGIMGRLRESLGRWIGGLGQQIETIRDRFGVWQSAELTDDGAKVLIYDAMQTGLIPARLRDDVHNAYFNAEALAYADCLGRTKWGLLNAFTRSLKQLNPAPAYRANLGLTKLLGG